MADVCHIPFRARLRGTPRITRMLFAGTLLCGPLFSQSFYPLRDVHAGLHGVGRTVFQGNRIEDFQVEILGVLQNAGPAQSIILAKLSGGPLAEAGIIQGMSGSPVYIDGKLLGAVALGFAFSKQPIAGIQPIEQMISGVSFSPSAGGARSIPVLHPRMLAPDGHIAKVEAESRPSDSLTQLLTPLALNGLTPATVQAFASQFRKLGFDPQQGVSSGSPTSQEISGTVTPGSMISVGLLSGDMSISADGTVTYVDGKRIYAFGHRFLDVGSTEMPFARAEVLAILPNLNTSFKLSSPKQWVGTILSDSSTAIAGEIGRSAHTIPAEITVQSRLGPSHTYHVNVVNDRLLTPFVTQTALFSAIDATERTVGPGTIRLRAEIDFQGSIPPLVVQDVFVSDSGLPQQAAVNAIAPLSFFLSCGFQSAQIKKMTFKLDPVEGKQQVYITQAWTSVHQVRPGDSVTVTFNLAGENGFSTVKNVTYAVPVGAPDGPLNFTVSDAATLNWPDFGGMTAASSSSPSDLVRLLNQYRGSEASYIRVWRSEPSFTINGPSPGGELTDPPPSTMLILADPSTSPMANAATLATRGSVIAELNSPMPGYVVSGAKTVQVDVKE